MTNIINAVQQQFCLSSCQPSITIITSFYNIVIIFFWFLDHFWLCSVVTPYSALRNYFWHFSGDQICYQIQILPHSRQITALLCCIIAAAQFYFDFFLLFLSHIQQLSGLTPDSAHRNYCIYVQDTIWADRGKNQVGLCKANVPYQLCCRTSPY